MALEVLKEVTEWAVDFRQPNHTYLVEGTKVLAYQQWHTGEAIWGTPMRFDRRGRQFEKIALKDSPFKVVDTPAD